MGPFPHDAPPATISAHNPVGTDGFEFVEFAHPQPEELATLFWRMGYAPVARHRTKNITRLSARRHQLCPQCRAGTFATRFAAAHGPARLRWRGASSMPGTRFDHAVALGAEPYTGTDKTLHAPAIKGIGGSLHLFHRSLRRQGLALCGRLRLAWRGRPAAEGRRLLLPRPSHPQCEARQHGQVVRLLCRPVQFPADPLLRYRGKADRPVLARAHQPCGRIRIPINELADEHSQIEEYLRAYKGEGIQHIAVGTDAIYDATDALAANGLQFMPGPPDAYYKNSSKRVARPHRAHPPDEAARHPDRRRRRGRWRDDQILLQVFSKTVIGPIFFEFIQRKGDDGFGEGNFKALFESIEADQIARGVLRA